MVSSGAGWWAPGLVKKTRSIIRICSTKNVFPHCVGPTTKSENLWQNINSGWGCVVKVTSWFNLGLLTAGVGVSFAESRGEGLMTHFGLHVMCLVQNTRDPYYIMFKPPNIVKIYLISYLVFMKKERMVTAWSNDINVEQGLMIMTIAMLMTMTIATVIMMVMMTLFIIRKKSTPKIQKNWKMRTFHLPLDLRMNGEEMDHFSIN